MDSYYYTAITYTSITFIPNVTFNVFYHFFFLPISHYVATAVLLSMTDDAILLLILLYLHIGPRHAKCTFDFQIFLGNAQLKFQHFPKIAGNQKLTFDLS